MAGPVISLAAIAKPGNLRTGPERRAPSSCSGSSSQNAPADMPLEVWEKVRDHPCYSEDAHAYFARMHVAVAPGCNIQCNYCNRKFDCANESRPGVVSERLTPEQAVAKVQAVAARIPQLSVVGIAGPGDALAEHKRTFETLRRIAAAMPDMKLCLSTNGLALPDHVATLAGMNISHVTITINAVDPEIGAKIYAWVAHNGKRYTGVEGARILRDRQLEGLERLVAAGVLVKVNSVLIPGVNDEHLQEVNKTIRGLGAFLHNVMPLISDPAHGTHYGLTGQRGPTNDELDALRDSLDGNSRLMRHCRQCRADAVGMLGEDRSAEFNGDNLLEPEELEEGERKRAAYRAVVLKEQNDRRAELTAAVDEVRALAGPEPRLIAVCTKGGGRINQHFGHAKEFHIYEASQNGIRFIGIRRTDNYCRGNDGDDDTLATTIDTLSGVDTILCAKIGHCPKKDLAEAGIRAIDDFALEYVETAIGALYRAEAAEESRDISVA